MRMSGKRAVGRGPAGQQTSCGSPPRPSRAAGAAAHWEPSTGQLLLYGLPALPVSMIVLSVAIYLPNFYTDDLGLPAGMLAWVFLAGRLWDAATDPLMGHLSDRTRTRWGRRRPYMFAAALPAALLYAALWAPAPSLPHGELFAYLLGTYLALYTAWTVFVIPWVSLGMELTPDYHRRTRLFGIRQAFFVAGMAAGMILPPWFARTAGSTVHGYRAMGVALGAITAAILAAAALGLREPARSASASFPFFRGLRVTFANRAFRILLAVYLTSVVGGSFIAPLTLYIGKYVIRAEWVVQYVMLAYLAGSVGSIPLWVRLARIYGKNTAWSAGLVVASVGYAISVLYGEGTWRLWIVLAAVVGAGNGCTMTLGPALSADVIDSDELETGQRREGAFTGIWSFADKAAVGLAVFIGLHGLEAIGYVPNVEQPPAVITGMKFLYCVLPAACHVLALVLFRRFPITHEVHVRIREALDARRSGSSTPGAG